MERLTDCRFRNSVARQTQTTSYKCHLRHCADRSARYVRGCIAREKSGLDTGKAGSQLGYQNRPSRSGPRFPWSIPVCSLPLLVTTPMTARPHQQPNPAATGPTYRSQSLSTRTCRNAHLTIRTELTCKFCRPERCVRTAVLGRGSPGDRPYPPPGFYQCRDFSDAAITGREECRL